MGKEINPSLQVSLLVNLVRPDGTGHSRLVALDEGNELCRLLLAWARGVTDASTLEVSAELEERLRAEHILLTPSERSRFVRLREWTALGPDDLIIASYPKSGTTWMQMIVHHLFSDGSMDFQHLSSISPYLPDDGVVTPGFQDVVAELPRPRFFKSHGRPESLPAGCRTVYLVRDPRDVVVSYFQQVSRGREFDGSLDEFVDTFIEGSLRYGSWFEHLRAWLPRAAAPDVVIVSYEALSTDFDECVRAVATLAGRPLDAPRSMRIREACTFDAMRAAATKLAPRAGGGEAFFRSGRVGSWVDELSPRARERIEGALRHALRELDPAALVGGRPPWWPS